MKFVIILFVVAVCNTGALAKRNDEILVSSRSQTKDGYHFRYETSGGQEREERGELDQVGDNLILRITGSYSYVGSDNRIYKVFYHADDTGYKAESDIISRDHPIPVSRDGHSGDISKNNRNEELPEVTPSTDPEMTTSGIETTTTTTTIDMAFELFAPQSISSAALAALAGGGLG